MKSIERQEMQERLDKPTGKKWWISENDKLPYYTIECESAGLKFTANDSYALDLFIRALSAGYILSQIDNLNEKAANARMKAKKAKLRKSFNPWKFIIEKKERKLYPMLARVKLENGFAYATDSHALIKIHFDYAPELEGKLVDDDMQPPTVPMNYPNCESVMLHDRMSTVSAFELEHDLVWYEEIAKKMKSDFKANELQSYCKIGDLFFSADAVEKMAYWLKYYTPTKCLQRESGCIQLSDADGNTFLHMALRIDNIDDMEDRVIYK